MSYGGDAYRAKRLDSDRYGGEENSQPGEFSDSDIEQRLPMMQQYNSGDDTRAPPSDRYPQPTAPVAAPRPAPRARQQQQPQQPPTGNANNNADDNYVVDPPPDKQGEDMEKQEPVQPVGFLCWIGFGCTVFGLAAVCIAFDSPYWVEAYPNSFNQFENIGLWEVCMNNYMHHKDYSQEIYDGCWWVFNRDQKFWKLHEWLLPPWMISVQVLVTGSLLLFAATALTVALLVLHFCPIINHEYHQTYALFSCAAMMFLNTLATFVGATVYGKMCQDREWMPNPQFNYLSWGFGFYIISGLAAIGAGVTFYLEAKRAYEELVRREVTLAKGIMDMVGWDPNLSQEPPEYDDYPQHAPPYPEPGYHPHGGPDYGLPPKS